MDGQTIWLAPTNADPCDAPAVARGVERRLVRTSYRVDPYFGVSVPQSVPGVATEILDPARTWLSADDFAATASRLVDMFRADFVKFEPFVDDTVLGAQPSLLRAA